MSNLRGGAQVFKVHTTLRHEGSLRPSLLPCPIPSGSNVQEVQWLNATDVRWDMTYGMPGHLIQTSRNGQVSNSRRSAMTP